MRPSRHERNFAIATELLSDAPAALAWANLGDWSTARHYDEACRALALRVGQAAALSPGDRVLDLACGHGASLALWPQAFGLRQVSGLEFQSHCVEKIRAHAPAGLDAIVHGRFDTLPASALLPAQSFDAAVCVDAAYHAQSLEAFAAFAAAMLKPQGRFAFTTLVAPGPLGTALRLALAPAQIPAASVQEESAVIATLVAQGFTRITVQNLDAAVLQGFADFVARRQHELSWAQKASAGWLKIRSTGWLCQRAHRHGTLHYALISATKNR
jgi:2-polyprenyl-3-methyl-5-hydroxy-6-metoxy-1,4-benzoquinol methylase